jgi:hypothetical protein
VGAVVSAFATGLFLLKENPSFCKKLQRNRILAPLSRVKKYFFKLWNYFGKKELGQ